MATAETTLGSLPVGAECVIREVRCERPVARRLWEMGMLPGTRVRLTRVAPLGDPLELRLRGYSLSIRKQEAGAIVVDEVREPRDVTVAARVATSGVPPEL
ncbi:MAG: ferrous iron transport protein A [Sandaracinaceae bacterium]